MGYVLRVRFASFFTGAAVASAVGIYFLHKDYKVAHEAIKHQKNSPSGFYLRFQLARGFVNEDYVDTIVEDPSFNVLHNQISLLVKNFIFRCDERKIDGLYKTLDGRVSSLETFKEAEAPKHIEAAE